MKKNTKRPVSLTVLIIGILATGMLLLQFIVFFATVNMRYSEQFRMAASDRARFATSLYLIVNQTPLAQRQAFVEQLNFVSAKASLHQVQPFLQDTNSQSLFFLGRLQGLYLRHMHPESPMADAPLDFSPQAHLATKVNKFQINWNFELAPFISKELSPPPSAGIFDAEAALLLSDNTWLKISYDTLPLLDGNLFGLAVELGMQLLLQLILAVAVIRYLMRPLRQLANFADRITPQVPVEVPEGLPEHGPSEVVRTSQAFRAMYIRIRGFMDERMRLLASISHDLRTPIARLRIQLENEPALERPDIVLNALDDLQNLAEDTITLARANTHSEPERKMNLATMLASMADDYEEAYGNDECFVEKNMCRVRVHIKTQAQCMLRVQAFRRCLKNLLDNALYYGNSADIYLEKAQGKTDYANIRIEDCGKGIPEEELENIFQPFYRLEDSRNAYTGGSGLGLSIARELAHQNNAQISIRNIEQGGLQVNVLVPLAKPH